MKTSEWMALFFIVCGFMGWWMNIAAIWHGNETTARLILRAVGVFLFPLGAVLGWL